MDWLALLDRFVEGAPDLGVLLVASRDGKVVAGRGDTLLFDRARAELPVFNRLLEVRREPSRKLSFYRSNAPYAFAMIAVMDDDGFYGDVVALSPAERAEELAIRLKNLIYALQAKGFSKHLDASLVDVYLREVKLEFE